VIQSRFQSNKFDLPITDCHTTAISFNG